MKFINHSSITKKTYCKCKHARREHYGGYGFCCRCNCTKFKHKTNLK